MKLSELVGGLGAINIRGNPEVDIESIEYDSRKVSHGTLFLAVRGFTNDGNIFVPAAVKNGAVAVLTDDSSLRSEATVVCVADIRKAMALVSDRFYGSPQEALVMTGITGTNGKTTTSYMVKSIFESGGLNCGLIGTIKHLVAGKEIRSSNTTPEAPDIHAYLAAMVRARQAACVMEVSSHSLALSRVYGIQFRAVALTNLTRDHLDFHGDLGNYLDAKGILFSSLPGDSTAVINRDDPYADHFIRVSRGGRVITYGFTEGSDIRPVTAELAPHGSECEFSTPAGRFKIHLPIPGKFNVSNAMAAAGIGIACGFPAEVIVRGLETMKPVKGRYETVNEGQPFSVIVDYAHAPDALERILSSVRELAKGRLISVFGCGGDRDRGKRPMMGEISARLADITLVTSDNPRSEDPMAIISEIVRGIPENCRYETVPDRAEAIRRALKLAEPGDTVVIAGKGHEDYQIIGGKRLHFDDAETARQILRSGI
ncbi:UDP-N-acetylmuramoyl-L-alanyl-D-glutamate--2,6-diaminopimelate ligase [bacterium]|nr:UDP-N-acetylmuramoyl-L-alanyl-D-glutamate--2,6-diaminopimelate ligase [bacterium]